MSTILPRPAEATSGAIVQSVDVGTASAGSITASTIPNVGARGTITSAENAVASAGADASVGDASVGSAVAGKGASAGENAGAGEGASAGRSARGTVATIDCIWNLSCDGIIAAEPLPIPFVCLPSLMR